MPHHAGMTSILHRPAIVESQGSVTRPDNTTAYAAADAWTNSASAPTTADGLIALSLAGRVGGSGLITDVAVTRSVVGTTNADFEIAFFTAAIAMTNDNSAFALTDAEALTYIGSVLIEAADWRVTSLNALLHKQGVNLGFVCASDSVTIYAAVIVRGEYTPTALEVLNLRAKALQD